MRILPLLFFACFTLILPSGACAQVMNEVSPLSSPDWVELYLASDASGVTLDGMSLVDSAGNTKKLEGTLAPGAYHIVEWSNKLNNKGDTVSLMRGNERIDSWEYGDTCMPEGVETVGKRNGKIVRLKVATKGAENTQDVIPCDVDPTTFPTPIAYIASPTPQPTRAPRSESPKPKKLDSPSPKVLSASAAPQVTASPVPDPLPVQKTAPFLAFIPIGMGITAYGIRELVKSVKSHI